MLSWTSRGRHCLLCTKQSPFRLATRTFAITPALERAKKVSGNQKKSQERESARKQKKKDARGAQEAHKSQSSPRPIGNARQNVSTVEFAALVETALKEYKRKLKKIKKLDVEGWDKFERYVTTACSLEDRGISSNQAKGPLRLMKNALLKAYIISGAPGIRSELEYLLYAEDLTAQFSTPNLEHQKKVADLRFPAEWYPQARAISRTIHLHVGPTNSGKTYHALQRLRSSGNGFYAGPLRLLAQEVYHRFEAEGMACSLITGDEVRQTEGATPTIVSNTVEMVSLGEVYDVGVIDEIQMIGDSRRGWAWTRAFLGARVKELHLCGEARAVPLIRQIAALTGDKLEVHHYERLNPLKVANSSLQGDLKNLKKGDCVVSFSRVGIHALKQEIEKSTGRRAAIVYGSLPAEIRTQQAKLFNDPDNDYDFLVASDAIGMGLNLSCKRIIFETLVKRVPGALMRLTVSEIKQIGGRAGRYRSATTKDQKENKNTEVEDANVGFVTSLEEVDLPYIRQAMSLEAQPLEAAGIFPPEPVFLKFASYFPRDAPLEYLIRRLVEVSENHPLFFVCDPKGQLENAELIDAVSGLRTEDQMTFMAAPIYTRDNLSREGACAFARCVTEHSNGRLLEIPELNLEVLQETVSGNKEYLQELEILHKSVILYLWLSFRFGGVFTDRTLATHVKQMAEERMMRALTEFSANKKLRKDASLKRQIALQKQIKEQQRMLSNPGVVAREQEIPVSLSDEISLEMAAPEPYASSESDNSPGYNTASDYDDFAEPEDSPEGHDIPKDHISVKAHDTPAPESPSTPEPHAPSEAHAASKAHAS